MRARGLGFGLSLVGATLAALSLGYAARPLSQGGDRAFERGILALEAGRPREALAAFREAAAARASDGQTYYGLGRAYYALGQFAAARDAFDAALRAGATLGSDHRRAMAFGMLARSHFMLGDRRRAHVDIDAAIALDPTEPTIRKVARVIKGS
jgi:tetratricopeptide (TPR) repeat protein